MDDCLSWRISNCAASTASTYTEYISTRWYRAPEKSSHGRVLQLQDGMWGVGACFRGSVPLPAFPGTNELDQIQKIHSIIGTPDPRY